MKHLFRYNDPIYDFPVYVMFNATPEKVKRITKLIWGTEYDRPNRFSGRALLFTHPEKESSLLAAFSSERPSYATVAHEAFHLTEYTMDTIGCQHSDASSEPWAYLLGFHVRKISQFIEEHYVPALSVRSKATD